MLFQPWPQVRPRQGYIACVIGFGGNALFTQSYYKRYNDSRQRNDANIEETSIWYDFHPWRTLTSFAYSTKLCPLSSDQLIFFVRFSPVRPCCASP